jgi:Ca2+-binding RTX toxin-like protein
MGSSNDLLLYQGGTHYDGGDGEDTFYADFSATSQPLSWDADASSFTPVDGITVLDIERFLLSSGSGDDLFRATQNGLSHHIETGAGHDFIELGAGNDYVSAGDGNDTISTGDGSDTIDAGAGNDVIDPGAGSAWVEGGAGHDRLTLDLSEWPPYGMTLYYLGDGQGNFGGGYLHYLTSFEQLRDALLGVSEFRIYEGYQGQSVQYRNVEVVDLTMGSSNDLLLYQGGTHYDGGDGEDTFYADFSAATADMPGITTPARRRASTA